MFQYWFIVFNQHTTAMQDVHYRGTWEGGECMWTLYRVDVYSVLSVQLLYEPKTALRKSLLILS